MPIYSPNPHFSAREKRLLALLASLLVDHDLNKDQGSNLPHGEVVLSDREAGCLIEDLKALQSSRKFLESAFFVEGTTHSEDESKVREIYLGGRRRAGKTRVMSTKQWDEFRLRLGVDSSGIYFRRVLPMGSDILSIWSDGSLHFLVSNRGLLIL